MTKNNFLSIGNTTTIINTIVLMCAGPLFGALVAHFGNLPVSQADFTMLVGFIVTTAFAYVNARFHNTFWDPQTDEITIPVTVTDATEDGINQTIEDLIEKYGSNNTINVEVKPLVEEVEVVDEDGC